MDTLENIVEAISQNGKEKGRVGKQEKKIKESTEKGQHPILKFLKRANKMTSTKILKDPNQDT